MEPPGELIYSEMSFSGSSASRNNNWGGHQIRDVVVDRRPDEDDVVFE